MKRREMRNDRECEQCLDWSCISGYQAIYGLNRDVIGCEDYVSIDIRL